MEEDRIDLKKYWLLLKRWIWLLILGLLLGAGAGYLASRLQTPVYAATTKVMIARGSVADQSLDVYSNYYLNELTQTYLELLKTETVITNASKRLGIDANEVIVNAQAIPDTTIIEIQVEHPNPQLAASIADMLVTVLIEKNDEIQSGRYKKMEESLTAQKSQIETQISALQNQIEQASIKTVAEQALWLQTQINALDLESKTLATEISSLANPTSPESRSDLEQKKARLEQVKLLLPLYRDSYTNLAVYGKQVDAAKSTTNSQLALLTSTQNLYQQIYQSVLRNLETVRLASMQNTPTVVSIESAAIPEVPIKPRKLINTVLAGMIGLMLTTGILVLNEYLDNTIKTSDDIEKLMGLSAIGYIADMQSKDVGETGSYVSKQPRSPIAEAFRSLRTNIEFSAIDKPIKTILVTSPEPETGKTTIASNLAAIFAQKGKRVLLMDADLRRPHLHRALNLQNRVGLTNMLLENQNLQTVGHKIDGNSAITVITSGSLPPNPAELLGSFRMERTMADLGKSMDVIVIDSPPSVVADAQVLAAKVDAVLLVIQPGRTQKGATKATIEILKRANARIIGVVVNRISRDRGDYYSHYHYEGYDYLSKGEEKKTARVIKSNKNGQGENKTLSKE
jgi:polysaccharide biosynthesis transport protein